MEWTCPHCQTELSSPENGAPSADLRPGWRYGRCFQCGGYAMIERSSNTAVKVERKAQTKSELKSQPNSEPPTPARAPGTPPPFPPELAAQLSGAKAKIIAQSSTQPQPQHSHHPQAQQDAQPIELQPLHTDTDMGTDATNIDDLVSAHLSASTRASRRRPPGPRISALTAGIVTMLGAIVMAGGAGVLLTSKIKATRSSQQPDAIAAVQAEKAARAQAAATRITAQSAAPPQATAIAQAPAAIPPSPLLASNAQPPATSQTNPVAQDSIRSQAMAPTRNQFVTAAQGAKLFVQARDGIRSLDLRAGPGLEHKSLGKGAVEYEYPVVEWKGRWFKIGLDDDGHKTAWVHYDKIEILSDEDSSR